MQFNLSSPPFDSKFKIEHAHHLFFVGSCFSESISQYFFDRKFRIQVNPHGVIYNPISIANSIDEIVALRDANEKAFYKKEGRLQSFNHHSSIAAETSAGLKERIQTINQSSSAFLKKADIVFITLGTAWAYYHKDLKQIVANNLKAPSTFFEQKLLSIQQITAALRRMIESIQTINSNAKIVFTVSPVRHAKQGLVENNRSKARLIEAVHQLLEEEQGLTYFPSYELVIDVLRDYRFYKKDLVHPSQLATDFVWEYLHTHFITSADYNLIEKLHKLNLATQHKLFNSAGESSKSFINTQLDTIAALQKQFPYLELDGAKRYFENL